jgi:hypothetical protein
MLKSGIQKSELPECFNNRLRRRGMKRRLFAALTLAAAALAATAWLSDTASAQVTLPYLEDFEGTSGEEYLFSVSPVVGAPDFSYENDTREAIGPEDNTIGAGSYLNLWTYHNFFDVTGTVLIQTVYVYPQNAGDVTVTLYDNTDTALDSVTVSVTTAGAKNSHQRQLRGASRQPVLFEPRGQHGQRALQEYRRRKLPLLRDRLVDHRKQFQRDFLLLLL